MPSVKTGHTRSNKICLINPCRTVIYQLLPPDAEARINYCRWCQWSAYDGMVDQISCFITTRHSFISAVMWTELSLLECRKSTLHSWGSITWRNNEGALCYLRAQDSRDSVLWTDCKFCAVCLVNIDSVLPPIDERKDDLREFQARQRNSAHRQPVKKWGKSSVRWACGEQRGGCGLHDLHI